MHPYSGGTCGTRLVGARYRLRRAGLPQFAPCRLPGGYAAPPGATPGYPVLPSAGRLALRVACNGFSSDRLVSQAGSQPRAYPLSRGGSAGRVPCGPDPVEIPSPDVRCLTAPGGAAPTWSTLLCRLVRVNRAERVKTYVRLGPERSDPAWDQWQGCAVGRRGLDRGLCSRGWAACGPVRPMQGCCGA